MKHLVKLMACGLILSACSTSATMKVANNTGSGHAEAAVAPCTYDGGYAIGTRGNLVSETKCKGASRASFIKGNKNGYYDHRKAVLNSLGVFHPDA